MKKILGLILTGFIFSYAVAQNYQSDFEKYFQSNDTINQLKTLKAWEKAKPKDAELYTSYFNYYIDKSRNETLVVAAGEPPAGETYFSLSDSSGNYAGFIGSQINYDESYLKKGLDKITEGIDLYPNRLDMRFGKTYVLGQTKDWDNFTKEIIAAIQYSKINNNNWTWTENKRKNEGKKFFLSSLQDYQAQMYNTGDDKLLVNISDIAKEVLKLYPDHVESLSNLSIFYMISNDYDKALDVLLKAERINPKDFIVLFNIAHCYKEKGDKTKSIEYYEKTIKYGDEQVKEYAKKMIEELKK